MRVQKILIAYAILTALVVLFSAVRSLRPWFLVPPPLVPLLGPPAILGVDPTRAASWVIFAIGTVACGTVLFVGIRRGERKTSATLAFWVLWIAFGLLPLLILA